MLFSSVKHGVFISLRLFHPLPPATSKEKNPTFKQPKEIWNIVVIKSLGGACGWGQEDMEEDMLL